MNELNNYLEDGTESESSHSQDKNKNKIQVKRSNSSSSETSSTSDEQEVVSVLKKPKPKKPGRKKKTGNLIKFEDEDDVIECKYCKKEFSSKLKLENHYKGQETKCNLKYKMEKLELEYKNLEKESSNKITELEKNIEKIQQENKLDNGITKKQERYLRSKLKEFSWPDKPLDKVEIKRFNQLCKNPDEAFPYYFKRILRSNTKPMGIFIKNNYGQTGLVFRRGNKLFFDKDENSIVYNFLKDFYFLPHFSVKK